MNLEYVWVGLALLAGIAGHIVKKIVEVRETDASFSLKRFIMENPYKTFMTVFYAVGGALLLVQMDQLSIYTALLTGFSANSLSGKGHK